MNHVHGHPRIRDEIIIQGIISGGAAAEQAMQDLYLAYRKSILGYIANLLRRFPDFRGQPEDLMHDAFIVLVHRIEAGNGQVKSLNAFWMGIARHLLFNQVRKNERILLLREPDETYGLQDASSETRFLQSEERDLLLQTFDQLGNRCKAILLLWIDRYPMHEIAKKMDLSGAPMARKIKHECFKKLKNLVLNGNNRPG
jgi:RNA polymerase sigma factor (sigma-70 family)